MDDQRAAEKRGSISFTMHDLLWLTLAVALAMGWGFESYRARNQNHAKTEMYRINAEQLYRDYKSVNEQLEIMRAQLERQKLKYENILSYYEIAFGLR